MLCCHPDRNPDPFCPRCTSRIAVGEAQARRCSCWQGRTANTYPQDSTHLSEAKLRCDSCARFLLDEHWPCYSDPQWIPPGTRVCDKNHGRMHRTVYDAGGPAACRGTASAWGVQDTMLNHVAMCYFTT